MLIKQAIIIDKQSKWHQKKVDVLIENVTIVSIKKNISAADEETISGQTLHISPSWIDIGAALNDPGLEYRESIPQLLDSALMGGYGTIAPIPSDEVPVTNKSTIEYITRFAKSKLCTIVPVGSLSANNEGKDIGELIDLHQAGCTLFTDGRDQKDYTSLLTLGALYLQSFGGKLLIHPFDPSLNDGGSIHEGKVSTSLGMKGIPAFAEVSSVQKLMLVSDDLDLNIVLLGISAAKSCDIIAEYNKKGKRRSCVKIKSLAANSR